MYLIHLCKINVNFRRKKMFLLVLLVFTVVILLAIKSCMRPKNFPNGPVLLPFIGSAWSLPGRYCELEVPKWKKKYGNMVGHKVGHHNLVFICGSEELVDGLKHPNFQGRIRSTFLMQRSFNAPLGFFFGDGQNWSEVRRFTVRYFGHVFTSKLKNIMHEELLEDFSCIKRGEITDIDGPFMRIPLNTIMKILISDSRNQYKHEIDQIQSATEKAFQVGRVTGIELFYPSLKIFFDNNSILEAIRCTQDYFQKRLIERKKNFDSLVINDYTDAFLLEQEKEKNRTGSIQIYCDMEYLSCVLDLIQAGNESTGKTIQFILLYVSLNLKIQDKLQEEIDKVVGRSRFPTLEDRSELPYVEATIYEAMRINPISPLGVMHRVTQDTKFKGYFFPENTLLILPLKQYLNDPETWNNPDEFSPERFIENPNLKKKVLNFGHGKRSCIGELLAKNSVFLYISYFFQKFFIHLPDGYPKPSTIPISGITNGPEPFKLIITERSQFY